MEKSKYLSLNWFEELNNALDTVMKDSYASRDGYACIDKVHFYLDDYDEKGCLEEPLLYITCRYGVERDEKHNLDSWQYTTELCVPFNSSTDFVKGVFFAPI